MNVTLCPSIAISLYYIAYGDTTISLPSDTTVHTVYGYDGTNVTVFAENAIGNTTNTTSMDCSSNYITLLFIIHMYIIRWQCYTSYGWANTGLITAE